MAVALVVLNNFAMAVSGAKSEIPAKHLKERWWEARCVSIGLFTCEDIQQLQVPSLGANKSLSGRRFMLSSGTLPLISLHDI